MLHLVFSRRSIVIPTFLLLMGSAFVAAAFVEGSTYMWITSGGFMLFALSCLRTSSAQDGVFRSRGLFSRFEAPLDACTMLFRFHAQKGHHYVHVLVVDNSVPYSPFLSGIGSDAVPDGVDINVPHSPFLSGIGSDVPDDESLLSALEEGQFSPELYGPYGPHEPYELLSRSSFTMARAYRRAVSDARRLQEELGLTFAEEECEHAFQAFVRAQEDSMKQVKEYTPSPMMGYFTIGLVGFTLALAGGVTWFAMQ